MAPIVWPTRVMALLGRTTDPVSPAALPEELPDAVSRCSAFLRRDGDQFCGRGTTVWIAARVGRIACAGDCHGRPSNEHAHVAVNAIHRARMMRPRPESKCVQPLNTTKPGAKRSRPRVAGGTVWLSRSEPSPACWLSAGTPSKTGLDSRLFPAHLLIRARSTFRRHPARTRFCTSGQKLAHISPS
jgi:hypothetical protein